MARISSDDPITGREFAEAYRIPNDIIPSYYEKLISAGLDAHHGIIRPVDIGGGYAKQLVKGQKVAPGENLDEQKAWNLVFQTWQLNGFFENHPEMHPVELAKLREELENVYLQGDETDTPELRQKNWRYFELTGKNVLLLPKPWPTKPKEKGPRRERVQAEKARAMAQKLKAEAIKKSEKPLTKSQLYDLREMKKVYDGQMPSYETFRDRHLKGYKTS
jgi:hypothetical protein